MQKRFLVIVMMLFIFVCIPAFAQSAMKIGVVDTDKVFQESVWGKTAYDDMEKETMSWQKKGEQIDKDLTALEEQLAKQRTFMENKEEEQKIQDQIDSKRLEGQNLLQQGQASLKQKQQELMDPIIQSIKDVIKKLATEESYDIILEKRLEVYQIVLFVKPEFEITNQVIVLLDKSYKDKNLTKVKESDKKESDKSVEKPKESEKKDGK
jgi:outer membrane protein